MANVLHRRKAFRGGGFSPSDLANLELWLKADGDVYNTGTTQATDGQTIATWADAGSEGNDVTQGTEGDKPTFETSVINSLPVVRYNDTGDFLAKAVLANAISQPYTIFIVWNTTEGSGEFPVAYDSESGGSPSNLFGNSDASNTLKFGAGGTAVTTTGNIGSSFQINSLVMNGASSEAWTDGVSIGTGNPGTNGLNGITIGNNRNENESLRGDIAEFILYSDSKGSSDRSSIESYLSDKYAL